MLKVPLIILVLVYSTQLYAQPKAIITYKAVMSMNFQDFKSDMDKLAKKQNENLDKGSINSLLQQSDTSIKALEQMLNPSLLEVLADTIQVWREGDLVIMNSAKDGHGRMRKLYELHSQRFIVVDSIRHNDGKRLDTTATLWLTCDRKPACSVKYKVDKKSGVKDILGYKCVNYIITEDLHDGQQTRVISIWATNEIKPAISAYGVLRLYKKILGDFTPLEIKEFPEKNALSYELWTATNISR